MAAFTSESEGEYAFNLTTSEEEELLAVVDHFSSVSPQLRPAHSKRALTPPAKKTAVAPSPFTSDFDEYSDLDDDPNIAIAIEQTVAAITDDDLSFDLSELHDGADDGLGVDDDNDFYSRGRVTAHLPNVASRDSGSASRGSRLAPSVTSDDDSFPTFVSRTGSQPSPAIPPTPDVRYPDLTRALTAAEEGARLFQPVEKTKPSGEDNRSPILRFRTAPKKPFSVTDLTSGAWCELQYFYTLTRNRGGKKTTTPAMKKGIKVHTRLERQIFKPVKVEVTKREDSFGLKIWNMIEGLRVLRKRGVTREFEVWGIVHGNVVCGVIDGMSYDNPDLELQEDVLSSRGSQTITNSQPYMQNTPEGDQIFISDVKTRNSTNPPPQSQSRVSLIQLFLYHRFISDMASDRLDYMRVFERYNVKPDEPFSNRFMAQLAQLQDENPTKGNLDTDSDATVSNGQMLNDSDTDSNNGEFVSAPSSPSQVSFDDPAHAPPKYDTLRGLLSVLKFELALTFPRGAADLGSIVAVEYRYRGRDPIDPKPNTTTPAIGGVTENDVPAAPSIDTPPELEVGSVICTNSFFVEPETLDLYLDDTMRWWKGERPPRGVAAFEAGFKCRSCEFADDCRWRKDIDQEALHRARMKQLEREAERQTERRTPGTATDTTSATFSITVVAA
ncbi:exonuclease V [Dichotomopilus funicola]|uniref:Exonuclease V n=1 Tax=Dichotomopilus funicola TaxID=1934379 RepID=A0AAN6V5U9_9PEZI|nr:exonuclease V [Dichotomopilus funicola]